MIEIGVVIVPNLTYHTSDSSRCEHCENGKGWVVGDAIDDVSGEGLGYGL